MAWVREKNPKRKPSAPQRDPKEALEGLLSYLACKPSPNANIQRYLREEPPKRKPEVVEVVQQEPTVYDEEDECDGEDDYGDGEDDYEPPPLQNQRSRDHQHHHSDDNPPPRRTLAPRHVSNVERRPYLPRTTVQTRRVMSSWSNATTPLDI